MFLHFSGTWYFSTLFWNLRFFQAFLELRIIFTHSWNLRFFHTFLELSFLKSCIFLSIRSPNFHFIYIKFAFWAFLELRIIIRIPGTFDFFHTFLELKIYAFLELRISYAFLEHTVFFTLFWNLGHFLFNRFHKFLNSA